MIYTINSILIFAFVLLPGLIFRRFFFLGEFSKQVSFKDSIPRSFLLSLIPSLLIQLLFIFIISLLNRFVFSSPLDFDLGYWIDYYRCVTSPDFTFVGSEIEKLWDVVIVIVNIAVSLYISSALLGVAFFLIIRYWKLDRRSKLLRYNNDWYYIFSSEILQFKKFEEVLKNKDGLVGSIAVNDHEDMHFKTENRYTKVDVLVEELAGNNFYSGIVVDYDLNHSNIQQLERLYLKDTVRYKPIKDKDGNKTGTMQVKVPGDYFIILGKEIKNINVSYEPITTSSRKLNAKHRLLSKFQVISAFISVFLWIPLFVIDLPTFQNSLIESISSFIFNSHWVSKVIFWLFFDRAILIFNPYEDIKNYKMITLKKFAIRFAVFVGLGIITYCIMLGLNLWLI